MTRHFATVEYHEDAILHFPSGLPAFEGLSRFLLIEHPGTAPLVFLQSLESPDVCLPAVPVKAVDPNYELALTAEDVETLDTGAAPEEANLGCLAVVSVPATGPATANLLAPVVVNWRTRIAVQSVRSDTRYHHQHPIVGSGTEAGPCS